MNALILLDNFTRIRCPKQFKSEGRFKKGFKFSEFYNKESEFNTMSLPSWPCAFHYKDFRIESQKII